ncbi:MAG: hypothetical protein NTX97_11225 [Bacteroidetes bacterium]|nr:hypothetical protein [Bacteroidota bacterium]
MKQKTFSSLPFALLLILSCFSNSIFSQYKISQIIEENKGRITSPFKYDGFTMTEFSFDLLNKEKSVEFLAFKGQKYKLFFCSSSFEESVKISVYDKTVPKVKIAEKIIDSTDPNWTYEPVKAGTYSIVYEIPPSNTDIEHKACLLMLIGFTGK